MVSAKNAEGVEMHKDEFKSGTFAMRKGFPVQRLQTIIVSITLILIISGCSSKNDVQRSPSENLRIAAAIFPAYDWTRNILGENPADAELTLLLDNGVDLHSFQPSVDDILTISNADLFIYVGGESDQWVTDALKQAGNPDLKILKMLDVVGSAAVIEETVEGMQADLEHAEEEDALDEHIWLSLRNAAVITDAIAAALEELDPANAQVYSKNAVSYKEKLSDLDHEYEEAVSKAPFKTILFGDRFPFRYLVEDYGLNYYAAFSGCSAETEASFETIAFLFKKTDELNLPAVLTIDGNDRKIAETIIMNTQSKNQRILTLNSMQSVTSKDIQKGITYLSVMENNLQVLKQALGMEAN